MRQIRQIIIVESGGACECSLYTFLPFVFEHFLKKKKNMERNDKQIALLGTQHNLSGLGESNLSLESGQPESQDLVPSSFPFGTGYAQRVGQWGEASLAGINPCQQDANEWVYMHFLI